MQMIGESAALQEMMTNVTVSEHKPEPAPLVPAVSPVVPAPAPVVPVAEAEPLENEVEKEVEAPSDEEEELTFEVFVRRLKRLLTTHNATKNSDMLPLIAEFEKQYSIDVTVVMQLLMCVIIDESHDVIKEIKKRGPLLRKYTKGNPAAQFAVLVGYERLCEMYAPLMTKVVPVLQMLYDEDIVEEASYNTWAAGVKKSTRAVSKDTAVAVREHAAKFIAWLKQAEVEDE